MKSVDHKPYAAVVAGPDPEAGQTIMLGLLLIAMLGGVASVLLALAFGLGLLTAALAYPIGVLLILSAVLIFRRGQPARPTQNPKI